MLYTLCDRAKLPSHFFIIGLRLSPVQLKMHLFFFSVLLVLGFPFIMSDVLYSFSTCSGNFFKEKPPMIKGILEDSDSQDNNRYKPICQRFKNIYRYATLYDTKNKIPVFSAYKYTGRGDYKTPKRQWKTEPQVMFLTVSCCFTTAFNRN